MEGMGRARLRMLDPNLRAVSESVEVLPEPVLDTIRALPIGEADR